MAGTKVTVDEPIIERACQRDSRHCMVAEAIQAQHPKWRNISVDVATIRWTNPKTRMRYTALTPDSIRGAILAFDQGEPVRPFSFTLTPVHRIRSTVGTKSRSRTQPELFPEAEAERQRQRRAPKIVTGSSGSQIIEGGPALPRGHMGGSATSGATRPGELEVTETGNVRLSGGRYRQYGLRQLRA